MPLTVPTLNPARAASSSWLSSARSRNVRSHAPSVCAWSPTAVPVDLPGTAGS
jgi:hypothetical protein